MADSHKDVFAEQDRFRRFRAAGFPGTAEAAVARRASAATVENSIGCLLGMQSLDGTWSGVVRSSVRTTAEFVILLSVIERSRAASADEADSDPRDQSGNVPASSPAAEFSAGATVTADKSAIRSAAAFIASKQLPIGGWCSWSETFDLDVSVLAYLALKLAGHDQRTEHMQRARDAILAFGGAEACGPFIRYYLALLGEVPYTSCLAIPPEFGMLPAVIPGSWASIHPLSRAVLTAVSIVWTQRPVWMPADGCNDFGELWKRKSAKTKQSRKKAKWTVPQRFFHILFGLSAKLTAVGYRQRSVRAAKRWLLNNLDGNHGFAGDATATIWTLLALLACGLSEADDSVRSCLRFLNSLSPVDGDPGELGVAKTNVRDTALACRVLGTADCSLQDVAIQRSVDWLLCREVQQPLESDVTRSALAGWSVQGRSADFVDVETTALVLLALREQFTDPPPRVSLSEDSMVAIVRASSPDLARRQVALLDRMAASSRRARQWLVSVQNSDGGWGRFGKCHRGAAGDRLPWCGRLITNDASSPSVTGVVLESISRWEQRRGRATRGAINYLRRTQRPDGNWCDASAGRGPIFATWRVVCGLRAANVDKQDAVVRAAAAWLLGEQCDSGGWRGQWRHPDVADFCAANQDRLWNFGLKSISVIHTAWALLALMAAGHGDSPSVRRGLQFLLDHQQTPGNWGPDDLAAGYRASIDCGNEAEASVHYPLLALATWLGSGPASLVEVSRI